MIPNKLNLSRIKMNLDPLTKCDEDEKNDDCEDGEQDDECQPGVSKGQHVGQVVGSEVHLQDRTVRRCNVFYEDVSAKKKILLASLCFTFREMCFVLSVEIQVLGISQIPLHNNLVFT